MANQIQIRRGTALEWTTANPILAQGEEGYELDTGKLKIGDGILNWVSLSYFSSGGGGGGIWGSITGTLSSQTDLQSALNAKESSISATTSADYYRGDKTFQPLNKDAVGLGNVDNTSDSAKPVSSAQLMALNNKQDTLVSATNIKTVNGTSLLGSGNLVISGGVTDHTLLTNIGTNTHAQIDTHIASTINPHSVTKAQVGLSNVPNLDTSTTSNITDSTNKRFVTDAQQTVISSTSGTNTGDQNLSGLELISNKATNLTSPDNIKYPTTQAVATGLSGKQDTLVSATNIKTLNGSSLLGSGNIVLSATSAWGGITGTLSDQTDLQAALNAKESALTFSTGLTRAVNTVTSNLSVGKSGGQSAIGGSASGENLTLSSTSNATKGKIIFGSSAYDESNDRLGVGLNNPTSKLSLLDIALAGSGSLAGSVLGMQQTWNTAGAPTAISLSVTDTTSSASSLLMDLRLNGSSKFTVNKDGRLTLYGGIQMFGGIFNPGTNGVMFLSATDNGITSSSFGRGWIMYANVRAQAIYAYNLLSGDTQNATSGEQGGISLSYLFSPGGAYSTTNNAIKIANTITNSGGETGITRGLYIAPTLNTPFDYRAIEITGGAIQIFSTMTASGTTGNQTINKITGSVNIAAAGTTVTVTNSYVTTSSIVLAVLRTNDSTAVLKNVVPSAGSFTINLQASATAEVSIGFIVFNK